MVRDGNADALGFYRRIGYEDARVAVLARWLDDPAQQCDAATPSCVEGLSATDVAGPLSG
jgi:hypothetical protein